MDLKENLGDKARQIVTVNGKVITQSGIEAYGN